jgi:hypothetical protein
MFDIAPEKGETKSDDSVSSLEGQLGWSVPAVKTLASDDSEHTYQLVISHSTKGTETTLRAELLRVDSEQKVVQRVLLYERRDEEIGD